MPMKHELYPADWREIALAVKAAAGWRCEVCGQACRRPGEPFDTHRRTLTVMHLNHAPGDCRAENLLAACSACHLGYDNTYRRLRRIAQRRKDKSLSKQER